MSDASVSQNDARPAVTPPWRGKKIVIFADGTGSSFAAQESNVWRLYDALDKTEKSGVTPAELQLARYIPGVGTSGNRILRLIDGATGIGVPSNVRKLYRFLCWNWQPGDEIYLFGFSRGAFTVRTLAGMLRFQGLMPLMIGDRAVSDAEMKRNTMRAWEAYREATAPMWQDGRLRMAPWIAAVRGLRDAAITLKRHLFRQPTHAEFLAKRDPALRPDLGANPPPEEEGGRVTVRYMGVFDTVEAYGFPFEFLRTVWSWCVWPITFRNRVCSRIVVRADHVLALDDERLTFHPIQFDQSDAGTPVAPTLIRERWFSGMHSDVGGGYPDDAVAMDPLLWIMAAAEQQGLRFATGAKEVFESRRYPRAVIHDSRAGLAATYRYQPRRKPVGPEFGGAPVLHRSALTKIRTGADGYAPLLLPDALLQCDGPQDQVDCPPAPMVANAEADRQVRKLVGWRVGVNRAQIFFAVLFVLLPLLDRLQLPLIANLWGSVQAIVTAWLSAIRLDFDPLFALYHDLWPWVGVLLVVMGGLWWWGGALQGRIKDQALRVWRFT
jgi:uncharacterized protein (DUF2235 family)